MRTIGLYVHVPFCAGKCPYCDFYSLRADGETMDAYTNAVCGALGELARRFPLPADTLYFGGGTPTLLGPARLARIAGAAGRGFGLAGAEITVETNPGVDAGFAALRAAGVNRVSMGLQSADAGELALLGRRHSAQDAREAVEAARRAGIGNVSLDLMLGIPRQTVESVENSAAFCAGLGATHLSAYLLKVEEGTPFARRRVERDCPDDDAQAGLYLRAVEALARLGYAQYEISNFARPGFESRHNLKYWDCGEYLGVGPSAHSCLGGVRFYYPRSLRGFLRDPLAVVREEDDSPAALDALFPHGACEAPPDCEEYMMLRLRLAAGLDLAALRARFPAVDTGAMLRAAAPMERAGLLRTDGGVIALTARGFLVSNAVIARLIL